MGKKTQFVKNKLNKLKLSFKSKSNIDGSSSLIKTILLASTTELTTVNLEEFIFDGSSKVCNVLPDSVFSVCNEIQKNCLDFSIVPNTQTITMSDKSFCYLVKNSQDVVEGVSNALQVPHEEAVRAIASFFEQRKILVQQKGAQGLVYKLGTWLQGGGSAIMVGRTVAAAKLAGVSGSQIITSQPLMLVTVPMVGAIFFHGCGVIAGPNIIGKSCNSIAYVLSLPMRGVELTYNVYISPLINATTTIPTILNLTQQLMRGPGLNLTELKVLVTSERVKKTYKNVYAVIKSYITN